MGKNWIVLAAIGLVVSGCANLGLGAATTNSVDVGFVRVPDRSGPCARALEVRYHIINGESPHLFDATAPGGGRVIDNPEIMSLGNDTIAKFYTPQTSKNSCYAAALATIWRAAGLAVDNDQFVKAADNPCGFGVTQPASFMQILYAANYVRTNEAFNYVSNDKTTLRDFLGSSRITFARQRQYLGGGVASAWVEVNSPFTDLSSNGYWAQRAAGRIASGVGLPAMAPAPMATPTIQMRSFTVPDMYRPVPWHYRNGGAPAGGIFPVGSTDELVVKFKQGAFLIAGLRRRGVGHTVIITGLEFQPDGDVTQSPTGKQFDITSDTRIAKVRYLDPARPDQPEQWDLDGTRFLRDVDFIIAFQMAS
jgi:hypothetical protein